MTLKLGKSSAAAIDELLNQGFTIAPAQGDYPLMPRDLTELGGEQLSNLYSHVIAWTNYVATQLSAAQIDERAAEKQYDMAYAKQMVLRHGTAAKGDKVTAMKAEVNSDPAIVKLSEELDQIYAYRKMIEAMYNNLERDGALISREITRRSGDMKSFRKDKFFA
jgi:hypothetical protein